MLQDQGMYKPVIHIQTSKYTANRANTANCAISLLKFKAKYFENQLSQSFQTSFTNFQTSMCIKFKANNLKGVQVMGKINLQCKSSFHMHTIKCSHHIKSCCTCRIKYSPKFEINALINE